MNEELQVNEHEKEDHMKYIVKMISLSSNGWCCMIFLERNDVQRTHLLLNMQIHLEE